MTNRVAFHSLPPRCFPFTITAYPSTSREDVSPVWSVTVPRPCVVPIPGLQETGQPVRIVVRFADETEERMT